MPSEDVDRQMTNLHPLASKGLFWAWVINDVEELVTMGPWSRRHGADLARRVPVPVPEWVSQGMSEQHVRVRSPSWVG